ncbi:MAG: 4-alpha-glucanotransferase [Pirellula sp.]
MESLFRRAAGQLIHVTSLAPRLPGLAHQDILPGTDGPWSLGDLGSGDIGPGAYEFLRFLHRAGQRWWQILPTGPVGYGYSPYQSPSSFAGNPWLISPALLARDGLLKQEDLDDASSGVTGEDLKQVDFHKLAPRRFELLRLAFRRQPTARPDWSSTWDDFRHRNRDWLDEHCLFTACKAYHQGLAWHEWEPALQRREPHAVASWRERLHGACEFESFVQYVFDRQWRELRQYASSLGVGIIGDIPIFVSMDSSDVWAQQHLFELDDRGRAIDVAGVPPDYFSESGQRWGNPLYRWDQHQHSGYAWWIRRFQKVLEWCDLIRVDHFRGFESYYAIPAEYPDAKIGQWRDGPRHAFFQTIAAGLGRHPGQELPVIAEDLGFITPEVHQLRDAFGFPGMRILQFGFGDGSAASLDLPHNYPRHCVAYTGTHDNDTVVGWFESVAGGASTRSQEQIDREKAFALRYLDCTANEIHRAMTRAIWRSVACIAITPVQDLLGLGACARMNVPGTTQGNWIWRCPPGLLTDELGQWLGSLTETYGRKCSS